MPAQYEAFGRRWQELHPGWEVRDWSEKDLAWLHNREQFEASTSYAAKADIARYEIVLREGGMYVDTDFEPLRAFDDVLGDVTLLLGEEVPGKLNNALFAASPGHAFLRLVVNELPGSFRYRSADQTSERTGPGFLTRCYRRWRATADEPVRVLPRERLYPYSWEQKHLRDAPFPEALAVHHWALSWRPRRRKAVRVPDRRDVRSWLISSKQEARSLLIRGEALADRVRSVGDSTSVPMARRRIKAVRIAPDRLMVTTRHGFPVLVGDEPLKESATLIVRGTVDQPGVEFLRRRLRPGDTFVEVGPGLGLLSIAAGWLVGGAGRVRCYLTGDPAERLVEESLRANRALGMPGPVRLQPGDEREPGSLAMAPETADDGSPAGVLSGREIVRDLVGVPEISLLRLAAGERQVEYLRSLRPMLEEDKVRVLDLECTSLVDREEWLDIVDELSHTVARPGAQFAHVASDGRLRPTTLGRVLQSDDVERVVLRLPPG